NAEATIEVSAPAPNQRRKISFVDSSQNSSFACRAMKSLISAAVPVDRVRGALAGRGQRRKSCRPEFSYPSSSTWRATFSRPTRRMSTFVAKLSLKAPMSRATSKMLSSSCSMRYQMPDSSTRSLGRRVSRSCRSSVPSCDICSAVWSRNTLPMLAVSSSSFSLWPKTGRVRSVAEAHLSHDGHTRPAEEVHEKRLDLGDRAAFLPGSENHRIRRLEPPRPDRLHEQIVQPVQLFVDVFEHEDVRTGSAASLAHPGKFRTADARCHEAEVSPAEAAPGPSGHQSPRPAAGEGFRAVGVGSAV